MLVHFIINWISLNIFDSFSNNLSVSILEKNKQPNKQI